MDLMIPVTPRPKFAEFMEEYQALLKWYSDLVLQEDIVKLKSELSDFCYLMAELQENPIGEALLGGITAAALDVQGKEQSFFAFAEYVTTHFAPSWREPLYKLITLDEHYFTGNTRVEINKVYLHKKGGLYTVEQLANMSAIREGFKPSVIYRDSDGQIWSRPIVEFQQRFAFFLSL